MSTHNPNPNPNPNWIPDSPNSTPAPARKPSQKLNRWSMARTVRSGRRLDRPANPSSTSLSPSPLVDVSTSSPSISDDDDVEEEEEEEEERGVTALEEEGKAIYMVSDGTGWTAEHSVNAALGQFEHYLHGRGCPVYTHLFAGVEDTNKLLDIIKQAASEGALLLYTLMDPALANAVKHACRLWRVPHADILRPTTDAIAAHLGVAPSGYSRASRRAPLTKDYFKRIDAIEFTIKQDNGAHPANLSQAAIVLVGVSRTGKTPLSTYLAQRGYKVANLPIVMGVALPRELFVVDQDKVFGLTIRPVALQSIRQERAHCLGFRDDGGSNYFEMEHVREELDYASRVFAQHPVWPVIDVTTKAIEETAAIIMRIYHDRKKKKKDGLPPRRYTRYSK